MELFRAGILVMMVAWGAFSQAPSCPSLPGGASPSQVFSPFFKKMVRALDPSTRGEDIHLLYFNRQETESNAAFRYIFKLIYNDMKPYFLAILSVAPLGSEDIENHQIIRYMQSSDKSDAIKLLGIWDLKEDERLPCLDLRARFWDSWNSKPNGFPSPSALVMSAPAPETYSNTVTTVHTEKVVTPAMASVSVQRVAAPNSDSLLAALRGTISSALPPTQTQTQTITESASSSFDSSPTQQLIKQIQQQLQLQQAQQLQTVSVPQMQQIHTVQNFPQLQQFAQMVPQQNIVPAGLLGASSAEAVDMQTAVRTAQSGQQAIGPNGKPMVLKFLRANNYQIGSTLSGTGRDKIMNPVAQWMPS